MIAEQLIRITPVDNSRLKNVPLENIPFGKYFTDHMLVADYVNGEWTNVEILPYQPLVLDPSVSALHYGQAIFEGIKAYKDAEGNAFIFRPEDNFKRFNISAERMKMPPVPADIFMEGMRQLVELDKEWIPAMKDHSLYIRPFMFATDELLGVKPSDTYKFMIILSPTGPYFTAPMKIYVEEKYTRAAPGGVGYAKAAGNYGSSMLATAEAKKKGFDQVLWTDAHEHKYVQEIGVMNVFFVAGNTILTPSLHEGTILAGITRDTAITILEEMGYKVEERMISIDELAKLYAEGQLTEVFGTGTAATISLIRELCYRDLVMSFNIEDAVAGPGLKKIVDEIRENRREDTHGWMYPVSNQENS